MQEILECHISAGRHDKYFGPHSQVFSRESLKNFVKWDIRDFYAWAMLRHTFTMFLFLELIWVPFTAIYPSNLGYAHLFFYLPTYSILKIYYYKRELTFIYFFIFPHIVYIWSTDKEKLLRWKKLLVFRRRLFSYVLFSFRRFLNLKIQKKMSSTPNSSAPAYCIQSITSVS